MDILSGEGLKFIAAIGIGTIISAIIGFIHNSKRNSLDYITKERSEWRKDLREIAEEIMALRYGDTVSKNRVITKLKVRLNPEGMDYPNTELAMYYLKEGHIWKLLDDFQVTEGNKKKLVEYLSALLKFDWERSKQEVRMNFKKMVTNLLNLGSIVWMIFNVQHRKWLILCDFVVVIGCIFVAYAKGDEFFRLELSKLSLRAIMGRLPFASALILSIKYILIFSYVVCTEVLLAICRSVTIGEILIILLIILAFPSILGAILLVEQYYMYRDYVQICYRISEEKTGDNKK